MYTFGPPQAPVCVMAGQVRAPGLGSPDIDRLYREDGARLWRAIFAYSGDREIANDAVAEAFAQCLRRGRDVRDPQAWIWRVSFRLAAGELKDRRREIPVGPVGERPPGEAGTLLEALGRLSQRQRSVLVLRYYVGYGTDEIAEIFGSSRATVRVHLSRGRRRLRELLGEDR